MLSSRRTFLMYVGAFVALAGCGGGGGLGLSGGSVPIGGRAVSGTAVLPDGTPVTSATVTAQTLVSATPIATTTTNASGQFTLPDVPTSDDVSVVVRQGMSNRLEAVVPRSSLAANPGQPLDIGQVDAITTLVAAAVHLEHAGAPEDAGSIAANQPPHLDMQALREKYSVDTQKQFISNPDSLKAQALTLIVPVANSELAAFNAAPTSDTASTALNGLLGYVRAAHGRDLHLDAGTRSALINAQLAGTIYSPDAIASALQFAGVKNATATQVSAASDRERTELTGLSSLGQGITAFEAVVIATDIKTHGGFQLDQQSASRFLTKLLNL